MNRHDLHVHPLRIDPDSDFYDGEVGGYRHEIGCGVHPGCWPHEDPRHYGEAGNVYTPADNFAEMFEGITELDILTEVLTSLRRHLSAMERRGWAIAVPIESGVLRFVWAGAGAPPPEDSAVVDGYQAHARLALHPTRD